MDSGKWAGIAGAIEPTTLMIAQKVGTVAKPHIGRMPTATLGACNIARGAREPAHRGAGKTALISVCLDGRAHGT